MEFYYKNEDMRSISKGQENKYKDFEPKLLELGKIGS